jgi:hypothetical protein
MRGRRRETGVANTVCCESEVVVDEFRVVLSMWQTYLSENNVKWGSTAGL